ncbi:helix-turn-helix domain-containing protein [Anaerolineales bacterium HSG24]|nr:helix-turn-helix domain-containing protein [Anaerolineales bacterium HSG24]
MIKSRQNGKLYPFTYRARELRVLATWIKAQESGLLIGLGGAGKSDLLGLLTYHPEIMRQYLPEELKVALVYVDLNNLSNYQSVTFYRVILRSLYEAQSQLTHIEPMILDRIEQLYRKVESSKDSFLCQSALREFLFICQQKEIRLVFMLDPFEQFFQKAPIQVLDNLRGIRDAFKANVSYIVGVRQEVAYLRASTDLGELYEILDMHTCWLGAFEEDDTRYVIEQLETKLAHTFIPEHRDKLVDLTGGYPALIKTVGWWIFEQLPTPPDPETWLDSLMKVTPVMHRLQELWDGLTKEQQHTLMMLQTVSAEKSSESRQKKLKQPTEEHEIVLKRLEAKHLCQQTDQGWKIFSPLFFQFIKPLGPLGAGKIYKDEKGRFFRGNKELTDLAGKSHLLLILTYFLTWPYEVHSIDTLGEVGWPDKYPDVSDVSVQGAISNLRKRIEPIQGKHCYLKTVVKSGYRFYPEGAPSI